MGGIDQTRLHQQRVLDKQTIGLRLRSARKTAGLTMAGLAKRINISVATLASAELGTIVMTHTLDYHVKLICQELKIDIRSIMD